MAYAAERLFVPVVDLCGHGRARTTEADGAGRFVALDAKTGSTLWSKPLRSPDFGCATVANDVVFTSTYDGTVYAFAARGGAMLWHAAMGANVSSCPAVAGGLLFVGSGVGRPGAARPELIAYGVG
jgi:alcohol dehydrogenase (cytochrome c)